MSNPVAAGPAKTYFMLLGFRAYVFASSVLFSLPLRSLSPLVTHVITLLLLAAEGRAAQCSLSVSDLRQKRLWTAANIALYAAVLIALAGCLLAPREVWSPDGFPKLPDGPASRILYTPDLLAVAALAAAFFTLPALRIRHWCSLPRDEGVFAGDAIPVTVYSDQDYGDGDEGDEGGPLAAAFRAQQEDRSDGRENGSLV